MLLIDDLDESKDSVRIVVLLDQDNLNPLSIRKLGEIINQICSIEVDRELGSFSFNCIYHNNSNKIAVIFTYQLKLDYNITYRLQNITNWSDYYGYMPTIAKYDPMINWILYNLEILQDVTLYKTINNVPVQIITNFSLWDKMIRVYRDKFRYITLPNRLRRYDPETFERQKCIWAEIARVFGYKVIFQGITYLDTIIPMIIKAPENIDFEFDTLYDFIIRNELPILRFYTDTNDKILIMDSAVRAYAQLIKEFPLMNSYIMNVKLNDELKVEVSIGSLEQYYRYKILLNSYLKNRNRLKFEVSNILEGVFYRRYLLEERNGKHYPCDDKIEVSIPIIVEVDNKLILTAIAEDPGELETELSLLDVFEYKEYEVIELRKRDGSKERIEWIDTMNILEDLNGEYIISDVDIVKLLSHFKGLSGYYTSYGLKGLLDNLPVRRFCNNNNYVPIINKIYGDMYEIAVNNDIDECEKNPQTSLFVIKLDKQYEDRLYSAVEKIIKSGWFLRPFDCELLNLTGKRSKLSYTPNPIIRQGIIKGLMVLNYLEDVAADL